MIWDCTMIRDELDMLECRLTEMEDYDVIHVLVEAEVTHRGVPKPLHYQQNRDRFGHWNSRIRPVAVPAETLNRFGDPWVREHVQRDMAMAAISAGPDDIVLISDVDEIPSPAALCASPAPVLTMSMRIFAFAANWVVPAPQQHGVIARWGWLQQQGTLAGVRDARSAYPELPGAGWHLTWFGGPEAIAAKAEGTCHLELYDHIVQANKQGLLYERGQTWFGGDCQWAVPDETWPRYIREGHCPASWLREEPS